MEVGIAELKARLSEILRRVRQGHDVVVLDREQPVARLVPIEPARGLVVRRPLPGAPVPGKLRFPRPRRIKSDLMELLRQERQPHR